MKTSPFWCILILFAALVFIFWGIIAPKVALADEEEGGKLDHVVSREGKSSFGLFLADLYNEHRTLYALVVTGTMALLGSTVASFIDFILKRIDSRKARKAP